jgi:hypothetical protein
MFGWTKSYNAKPIGHRDENSYNLSDYTYEGDGLHRAFEEAYAGMSEINALQARFNTRCVNVYAEAYHETGSHEAALEAVNNFEQYAIIKEGFLTSIKEGLLKIINAIKEKIIAFFKSVVRYFDEFFMDADKFASKYEKELDEKNLAGFKYAVYEYNLEGVDLKKSWAVVYGAARKKAEELKVQLLKEGWYIQNDSDDFTNGKAEITWFPGDIDNRLDAGYKHIDSDAELKGYINGGHVLISDAHIQQMEKQKGLVDEFGGAEQLKQALSKYKGSIKPIVAGGGGGSTGPTATQVKQMTTSQHKSVKIACYDALCDGTNSPESFKKGIRKKLQGGRTEPKEIDFSSGVGSIVDALKNYKDVMSSIDDAKEAMVTAYDELKEKIDKVKDDIKVKEEAARSSEEKLDLEKHKVHLSLINDVKQVYTLFFDTYTAVCKERTTNYKKCMAAALHFKAKEED